MASRLLVHKGVNEYVEEAKILKNKFKYWIYITGDIDTDNPSSISDSILPYWTKNKFINYIGFQKILKKSCVAVLPSYREVLPKFLIEASTIGRAIITTNFPGCKDAIINGKTGLLLPAKDPNSLANAIKYLINNKNLMIKMGI